MRKGILLWTMVVLATVGLIGCEKKAKQEPAAVEQQMAAVDETQAQQVASGTANVAAAVGQAAATAAGTAQTAMGAVEQVATATAESMEKPTIEKIQQALKNAGLYQGDIDGKLGPRTKKAIEEFQTQNGLAADGKVGPKTWAKLSSHLASTTSQDAAGAPAQSSN